MQPGHSLIVPLFPYLSQMYSNLKKIVFLDIETVAAVRNFSLLPPRMQELWRHKATFIKNDQKLSAEELFTFRAGIYSEFGKVVVIVLGMLTENQNRLSLRTKTFADEDEKKLLTEFKKTVEPMSNYIFCAHNGKEFDFPYLCRRMLVNGIALPKILHLSGRKPWEIPHVDTLELWKFGDYKHQTSLDLMAALFDIPSSKGEMDGSMVHTEYYEKNNLAGIAKYCVADVVTLAQLYLKLTGQTEIDHSLIEHT